MSAPVVKAVTKPTILGEGPHWDDVKNVLYYVDIMDQKVHKYDPEKGKHTSVKIDEGPVSFVVPLKGRRGAFAVSAGRSVAVLTWDGESGRPAGLEVLASVEDDKPDNRFNDGKADPKGRLWAGTMGPEVAKLIIAPEKGSLFGLAKGQSITKHVSNVTCSNGLAWSEDQKTMFYIDSTTFKVEAFDYDIETGVPSNRRTVFDFKENEVPGVPDGMTIDTEGKLWVACFDGGRVIQVEPATGKLLQTIIIPSPKITSVAFGGKNLDELYVTSATTFITDEEKKLYPTAGSTYRVTGIGSKGFPMHQAVL